MRAGTSTTRLPVRSAAIIRSTPRTNGLVWPDQHDRYREGDLVPVVLRRRRRMDRSTFRALLYRGGDSARRPVELTVTKEELRLAVRAVQLHTAQRWPSGTYCRDDRSPYPCRLRRWGERMLLCAGWRHEDIEALARDKHTGLSPWLVGVGGRLALNMPPDPWSTE